MYIYIYITYLLTFSPLTRKSQGESNQSFCLNNILSPAIAIVDFVK